MERRYFIIDLPNVNVVHALSVRLGEVVSDTYNNDNTKVFIKTTEDLIANSSKSFNSAFPKALTNEYTLEEVKTIVNSWNLETEI